MIYGLGIARQELDCFVASLLATTREIGILATTRGIGILASTREIGLLATTREIGILARRGNYATTPLLAKLMLEYLGGISYHPSFTEMLGVRMFSRRHKKIRRKDVHELFYITAITNLDSILTHGILSHNRAARIAGEHDDISDQQIQNRRRRKFIERALPTKPPLTLHQCVNLYLNPHNAMMNIRRDKHTDLCVIRISSAILTFPEAVMSTANAATDRATFMPADDFELSEDSSELLTSNSSMFFHNQYRNHDHKEKHKQVRQSECLIPYMIHPNLIGGIFISSEPNRQRVQEVFTKHQFQLAAGILVLPELFYAKNKFDKLPSFKPLDEYAPTMPIEEEEIDSSQETLDESKDKLVKLIRRTTPPSSQSTSTSVSRSTSFTTTSSSTATPETHSESDNKDNQPSNFFFCPSQNLLGSMKQALVNTVNCKGVMGKGIAKDFKQKFPLMFEQYKRDCEQGKYVLGEPVLFKFGGRFIINFPTKNHWRDRSNLMSIEAGLIKLRDIIRENKINSLALPALGCGNGKLTWEQVYPLVKQHLEGCGARIFIYANNPELLANDVPAKRMKA